MARYVVIEFAKNADADDFIERIHQQTQEGILMRIAGVFVKPSKYCQCPDWERINYGDKNEKHGVGYGSKFGWWVCTYCNRPRRAGHQLINQVKLSELYPELMTSKDAEYEFAVTNLSITGIHTQNIDRPKKLRKVRKLWRAATSSSSSTTS